MAAQGQNILQNGQPAELAALLALHSLEMGYSPAADSVLQSALQHGFAVKEYVGHGDTIRNLEISANGLQFISISDDHTARLWDTATGEVLQQFDHGSAITTGRLSNEQQYVATSGTDGKIIIWSTSDGTPIQTLQNDGSFVWVGDFSPDSQYITSVDNSDTVRLWDIASGEVVQDFVAPASQFGSVTFTQDGRYLVAYGSNVVMWDVETGEVIRRFFGHTDFVNFADISPDGRRLLTGSADRTARLWDIATGQEIRRLEGHTEAVFGVEISPSNRYAVTTSEDGTARVWYLETGEELNRFQHPGALYSVRYLPGGNQLLTAGSDRSIRLWQLDTQSEPLIFAEEFNSSKRGELNLGAGLLENDIVLTSGENAELRLWQREDNEYVIDTAIVFGHQLANVLTYHPDTQQVVTASVAEGLQLWDATSGEHLLSFTGYSGTILDAEFSVGWKSYCYIWK